MPSLIAQRIAKSAALLPGMMRTSKPGLTVLLYHRVGQGARNVDLSAAAFDEQLAALASTATLVSLSDGLARAADPACAENLVALTFDDGTADFHPHVLPLLAKHGAHATLYVSTGPVDEGLAFPSWAGGADDIPALSWSQLAECRDSGLVTIGSHTHTHADLDRSSAAQLDDELRRSKALIQDRLGIACTDFAYPHAVSSSDAEAAVKRVYETAAIGGWRTNPAGSIDRYRIARVPITRADGPVFFRAKVRGRMSAEALLYRIGGTKRD